jgi:hypothetical protein
MQSNLSFPQYCSGAVVRCFTLRALSPGKQSKQLLVAKLLVQPLVRTEACACGTVLGQHSIISLPAAQIHAGDTVHSVITSSGDHYQNFQTRIM